MHSKLTLTIDKDVIVEAKDFAEKQGASLSSLIENYLKLLTRKEEKATAIPKELLKLKGAVKLPKGVDYKTVLKEALTDKYLK